MITSHKTQHFAARFVDLLKAFVHVDHTLLERRLVARGLSETGVGQIHDYLSDWTQCVQTGLTPKPVKISRGVPQGSVLEPLSFIINNINHNVSHAEFRFYADDTDIQLCILAAWALANMQLLLISLKTSFMRQSFSYMHTKQNDVLKRSMKIPKPKPAANHHFSRCSDRSCVT